MRDKSEDKKWAVEKQEFKKCAMFDKNAVFLMSLGEEIKNQFFQFFIKIYAESKKNWSK